MSMGEPNEAGDSKVTATPMSPVYDPDTVYVTGWQMSMLLGVQPASLTRWLKQWELGVGGLGEGGTPIVKASRSAGYRIPITYTLVGRGWKMTQDEATRQVMVQLLPADPKPFLIVVGNRGYTCYDAKQASQQVTEILSDEGIPDKVQVFYVGEVPEPPT